MRHILVAYDVSTESPEGKRRLRRVAKICESYGQRVQNSVFECLVDAKTFEILEGKLRGAIKESEDSLRIYWIAQPFQTNLREYGQNRSFDFQAPLIL